MDREPPKGLKWPAEGLHYTWGLTRGSAHTRGQTEFQCAWVHVAAWYGASRQVQYLAAEVLGLTRPREVETFVLFLDVRQNP